MKNLRTHGKSTIVWVLMGLMVLGLGGFGVTSFSGGSTAIGSVPRVREIIRRFSQESPGIDLRLVEHDFSDPTAGLATNATQVAVPRASRRARTGWRGSSGSSGSCGSARMDDWWVMGRCSRPGGWSSRRPRPPAARASPAEGPGSSC